MSCDTAIEHLAATLSVRTVSISISISTPENWQRAGKVQAKTVETEAADVWALLCNPIFGFDFIYMY